jgi:hypothetical protein
MPTFYWTQNPEATLGLERLPYAITTMVGENMVTVQGPTVNQSGLTRNRKQYDVKSGESTLAIELP